MSENVAERPPLPALTRALVGPPGKVLLPLVAVAGLIVLDYTSVPGGGSLTLLLAGLALLVGTVVVWVARFAVGLLRSDGRPGLRRHWARWTAAPVMGVIMTALVFTRVPFEARFALSESELEQFARTVAADTTTVRREDQWVGLYPLTSIERLPGGARFLVSDTGFLDRYGFAWSPGGTPPEESHTAYTHLEGPWYVWESRF
ncbi:hypothetical protein ABT158_36685 [Nonomuraea sp. NPDC001636]|uniref:hypothetical protein n=1 Tax=Nonomuraea sp. NPDC001636 TaxID=3154391 RepID=UPI0033180D08